MFSELYNDILIRKFIDRWARIIFYVFLDLKWGIVGKDLGDILGELQLLVLFSHVPLHQEEDQYRTAKRGDTADLPPLLLPRKTGTPDALETLSKGRH